MVLRGEVESAELAGSAADAERLLRELPFGRAAAPDRPDRFVYEITVTDGDRSRSVQLGEGELPDGLWTVVDAALAHGTIG